MECRYRIEREAEERALWQWALNALRTILFLPVTRTSDQIRRDYLSKYIGG
ncbi:MAG: hypothetical protein LRZ85_06005 [Alphaproteobacteria bacterium]|nr:hypothetical protein [Alphaproteobacteria bacterium]MCD8570410.1 hypothetical protein [Alphaproteobacteria bacterium]